MNEKSIDAKQRTLLFSVEFPAKTKDDLWPDMAEAVK
jgi:hypothetical protein